MMAIAVKSKIPITSQVFYKTAVELNLQSFGPYQM